MNTDSLSKLIISEIKTELNTDNIIDDTNIYDKVLQKYNNTTITKEEKEHLYKIKERILVLFEILNSTNDEIELKKRLEITISFIEFLLAHIEERIKTDAPMG